MTYTFTYDYENRITAITGGSTTASFVYDASGQRVKGTVNGVTTVYIAGLYEYQNGATTHYYEGNAIRRTGYATDNGVFYNLRDHASINSAQVLGSASALINQNGTLNGSRNYFFPFGGNRGGTAFNGVTNKRFTGQYHEKDLPGGEGLSYYGARWYDAKLGRFLSPDTIVPGPGNPQAFNRYSYVLNRPTGLVDPSGHAPCSASGGVVFCDNAGIKGSGGIKTSKGVTSRNQASPKTYKGSNLSTQEIASVQVSARKFGLPFQFLAAAVHTQKQVDYKAADRFEDESVKTAISLVRSHQQYLQTVQQFPYAQTRGTSQGMGGSAFLGHTVLYTATMLDSSLGVGQVRISTAQRMEDRYGPLGLLSKSATTLNTIERLESPDTNIEYVAAYLRYLTDIRTNNRSNLDDLAVTDMQIIYGAYRAGIQDGYGSEINYSAATTPGSFGSLLNEEVIGIYE